MLIYEVNLAINNTIFAAYESWLSQHIIDMLALPGFVQAQVFRLPPSETQQLLCIHYQLTDQQSLDNYLKQHAASMRAQAIELFGEQFGATRRFLYPKQTYTQ